MAFAVAGAVLTFAGVQRARFRIGSGGPGLVQVDRGPGDLFRPATTAAPSPIRQLERVELDPAARPARWLLTESGQPPLAIPTTAEGAEALFDVFASLDGIQTERMLAEMKKVPTRRVVIWQIPETAQLAAVLH